jgi:hypothetical protein
MRLRGLMYCFSSWATITLEVTESLEETDTTKGQIYTGGERNMRLARNAHAPEEWIKRVEDSRNSRMSIARI